MLPAGLAVTILGYLLMGACDTVVHPVAGSSVCFPGPYLGIGVVVALAGFLTVVSGIGLLVRPHEAYELPHDEMSTTRLSPEERRLRHRSGVILFLIIGVALVAVEIYLVSGLPMGVESSPGHFEYFPTFLLSLIPIVVSGSFVVYVLWKYIARE